MPVLLTGGPADCEVLDFRGSRRCGRELVVLSYCGEGHYVLEHGPLRYGSRRAIWRPNDRTYFTEVRLRQSRPRLSRP